MKLLLSDIPDDGLILDIAEKFAVEEISLLSPVTAHLELFRVGSEVVMNGTISADVSLQCSRCLKEVRRRMDIPVSVVYHPVEEIGTESYKLKDDEMDMGFYRGEELDLQDLLREQLLLNIQMKPLCDENCKGICPRCGADFNTAVCTCGEKEVDPRLAVLKKLLNERKE